MHLKIHLQMPYKTFAFTFKCVVDLGIWHLNISKDIWWYLHLHLNVWVWGGICIWYLQMTFVNNSDLQQVGKRFDVFQWRDDVGSYSLDLEPLSEASATPRNALLRSINHRIAREIAKTSVSPWGDIDVIAIDRVGRMVGWSRWRCWEWLRSQMEVPLFLSYLIC